MKKELMKQVTLATTLLTSLSLAPLSSLAEESTPSSSSTGEPTIVSSSSETRTATSSDSEVSTVETGMTLPSSATPDSPEEVLSSSSSVETTETEENAGLSLDEQIAALGKEGVDTRDIRNKFFLAEHPGGGSLFFSTNYQSQYGLPPTIKASRQVADKAVRLYAENYLLVEKTSQSLPTANIALAIKSNQNPSAEGYALYIKQVETILVSNKKRIATYQANPATYKKVYGTNKLTLIHISQPYYVERVKNWTLAEAKKYRAGTSLGTWSKDPKPYTLTFDDHTEYYIE